jgi:hypothetical protein
LSDAIPRNRASRRRAGSWQYRDVMALIGEYLNCTL